MSRRALLLFAAMSIIWGIPYLFIRIAVEEITPATLVFWRTAIAAVILLPVALARTDMRPVFVRWRWVVAFAAVEIAIPWVALASAEQHITSSLAGLLIAGVPLVGAAIATDSVALVQMGIVVVGYALGPAILARRLDGLPTVGIMAVSLAGCAIAFAPIAAAQSPTGRRFDWSAEP